MADEPMDQRETLRQLLAMPDRDKQIVVLIERIRFGKSRGEDVSVLEFCLQHLSEDQIREACRKMGVL